MYLDFSLGKPSATEIPFDFLKTVSQCFGHINKRKDDTQKTRRREHVEHSLCAQPIDDIWKCLYCAEHHYVGQGNHNTAKLSFNLDKRKIYLKYMLI